MIVRKSISPQPVGLVLWLALTATALVALWYERHHLWLGEGRVFSREPWWLVPGLVLFCGLVAWVCSRPSWVRRAFLSRRARLAAVWTRAELEFYREGLTETQGSTGILLFLSLFERQAVVLADKSIAERLPTETWGEVVDLIIDGARTGRWRDSLEAAVRRCGNILALNFPASGDDANELPDHVILKD